MRTLIVEDELTSLRILGSILEDVSELSFATSASEAFQLFVEAQEEGEGFDLICLDVNMPNISGLDLLKEIRSYEESLGLVGSDCVKVFMVTADSDPQHVYDSTRQGCNAYFTKPLDRKKFIEEFCKIFPESLLA